MARHVLDIFLSSTSEDLREHRTTVTDVLGRLGQFVVRMESFGARPNKPLSVCREEVLSCDALIVVVGHRYGWIPSIEEQGDGERSITWWEVKWALDAGKPVYAFLVDPKASWTGAREQDRLLSSATEADSVQVWRAVRGLQSFRSFLESSTTRESFTTSDQLGSLVSTSLFRWLLQNATPSREAGPADTASAQRVPADSTAVQSRGPLVEGHTYWHELLHLISARELVSSCTPTRVAIVAGRPRENHPALTGVALTPVAVKAGSAEIQSDDYTTALAALIASDGTHGFLGVAPGTELVALSVLDEHYGASNADIALGIDRAVLGGARAICLALGGAEPSPVVEQAVNDAVAAGVTVVCPAGNRASAEPEYPAAQDATLAVGAIDSHGAPTTWTSYGSWVHVAAPGNDVSVPAGEDRYSLMSGTSWSCAIATGVVALMLQATPELTPAQIKKILIETARSARDRSKGKKVLPPAIDAYSAVRRALYGVDRAP